MDGCTEIDRMDLNGQKLCHEFIHRKQRGSIEAKLENDIDN